MLTSVSVLRAILPPALITGLVIKLISWRNKVKQLPPGPPKLPLIGNLHNMPDGYDCVKFNELAKQYGSDVIHLSAPGYSIVVLNTFESAKELLANRSGIYSDRPASIMANELSGMGKVVALLPYGDDWRTCRRIFAKHFGTERAKLNRSRELFYARRCLSQLLETPDDYRKHVLHLVGSISLSISYGVKTHPKHDEYIDLAQKVVQAVVDIMAAGVYLVDVIPGLKYVPAWFPGATFQRTASHCAGLIEKTRQTLFKVTLDMMKTADYSPSLTSEMLEEKAQTNPNLDGELIKDIAFTMYGAAADTTWSTLIVFILAMVRYPEAQKRLRDELDATSKGRLPEHDDILQLPYWRAVFMEVLRWKPISPIGAPHVNTKTDIYRDYLIPNGSVIIPNQWAMLQNPEVYSDPTEFKPERFLKDGMIDNSVLSPLDITFGFGRRICPGRYVAQSTFMIAAASIISTFDILPKQDKNGMPIQPDPEIHFSVVSHPKDFPCLIVPRSAEARQLINNWAVTEGDNPL